MKPVCVLRLSSLLGFLLMMAPFYDQCNGHGMKKAEPVVATTLIDTTAVETPSVKNNKPFLVEKEQIINKDFTSKIKRKETPFYIKAYKFIDDENNQNAFELADMSRAYFEGSFAEFKEELSKDFKKHKYDGLSLFIRSFSFVFIVITSFFILILSFLGRIKGVYKLSSVNIFLIVITLICILFFDSLFETYKQIKWGYYAFITVQLAIYYTSKIKILDTKPQ